MERTLAHNLNNGERTEDVRLKEIAPFNQWLLKGAVKRGLEKAGFRYPTVIQASAIPVGKSGMDLLIQSKSGTGKTLIFCTVLLENCYDTPGLHSIIVTPTREIAIQIDMVLKQIGHYCKNYVVVNTIGGTDIAIDRKELQNARTVVGTPGRLVNLIQSDILKTKNVKLIVLDEVDQLYSSSHRKNLAIILNAIPSQRQILACSATFCNKLDEKLAQIMKNPLLISTKDQVTALLGIKQYIYELPEQKTSVLEMEAKVEAMIDIFRRVSFKLCIIFAGSQSRAESYSSYLSNSGWKCELISGAQKQAKRNEIFKKFQNFQIRILVSTDLMARGVDSEHLNLVINVEPPRDMVTYLHRIGRAGRFGSHGIAITLVSSENENSLFKNILEKIGSGMNIIEFPQSTKDGEDENFWDPNSFKTEVQQEKTTESEESCVAVLREKENFLLHQNEQKPQIETSSVADSNASLDTKTFCIDSKDSAVNVLPELVVENKEILIHLHAEDTPTSNRSSVQLSANTIDDASSIAADSVFSSMLETHAPHPSLALDQKKDLDYLSAELKEVKRDQVLNKDLFMDYCTNVLNDAKKIETAIETNEESLHIEETENGHRAPYDDMFADYTNFIRGEGEELEEENDPLKKSNNIAETSNEKDESLLVCLSSLAIDCNENGCNDLNEQKTQNEVANDERFTDSLTYLQDTICATNGSYSADTEPSMESKSEDELEHNQLAHSEFYFEESLVQNGEVNTQVDLNKENGEIESENEENESQDTQEAITENANGHLENVSPIYDIWMKEYWRQVNFIQSYAKYTLDYRNKCDDN